MWCLTATQPCVLSTQRDHVSFPGRFLHLTLDMNDFLESLFLRKKQRSLHTQHPASGNQSSVYRHLRLAVVEWCWWRHSAVVEWWQDKQREKRICSKKKKSLIWMKTGSNIWPKIRGFFLRKRWKDDILFEEIFCFHQVTVNWAKLKQNLKNISPKGRKAIFISFDRWRLNHVTVAATPGRLSFRNSPPLIRLCSASAFDCRQSPATSILDRDTNSIMLGCTDRIHLCPPVALCSGATAALGTPQTPMHAGPRRWVKWVRRTQRPAHTPTMRSRLPPQHVIVTTGPIWPTRAREKKTKQKSPLAFSPSIVSFTHLFILLSQSIILLFCQLSPRR